MQELQNIYTIERALSAERPSQLPDIPAELRPIDRSPGNTSFLEVCRQEEQFASTFVAKEGTGAFKLVSARSETAEGMTIKEDFNIRIERLHYKEKVPDIKQRKAKADLGSQQAATFVEGQCHTSNRLLESGFLQPCQAR
jgi:hypothetical protein